MSLIKRIDKGSKLTIQEMDDNLSYLEQIALNNSWKANETFDEYELRSNQGTLLMLNNEVQLPFTTLNLESEILQGKWNELDINRNNIFSFNNRGLQMLKIELKIDGVNDRGNTFFGSEAGVGVTGSDNIAIGTRTMKGDISIFNCIAIGHEALQNVKQSDSLAIGYRSQKENTTGNRNLSIGNSTLLVNLTGGFNTALGFHALWSSISASWNVALGYNALASVTTGGKNIAIGNRVADGLSGNSTRNVIIGDKSLILSGLLLNDNIFIGGSNNSGSLEANNQIVIGTAQTGKGSNTVLIGGSGIIETWLFGKVITDKPINLKGYTVSTLPSGELGDTAFVNDALTPTYLGVVTGGGNIKCPVFFNGVNWIT